MHYKLANPHHHQFSPAVTRFIALCQKHKLKQETKKVGL